MAESIAETFFLVATDGGGERCTVRADLLQSGVAGGVFADLALRRFLRVDDAGLVRATSACGGGTAGSAAAHVVATVAQQTSVLPVRQWIEELGPTVFALVCRQLVDAAVHRSARPADRGATGPPVDPVAAVAPHEELTRMLREPRRFTLAFGIVAVLADIAGLTGTFSADLNEVTVREILAELVDNLPGDLRAITCGVRAAATNPAVLPRR